MVLDCLRTWGDMFWRYNESSSWENPFALTFRLTLFYHPYIIRCGEKSQVVAVFCNFDCLIEGRRSIMGSKSSLLLIKNSLLHLFNIGLTIERTEDRSKLFPSTLLLIFYNRHLNPLSTFVALLKDWKSKKQQGVDKISHSVYCVYK